MIHFADPYLISPTHQITVTVVGVGGNGTQALHDLAKIHMSLVALGHPGLFVTAIDPDIVETPNIGRQKFSEADLGCLKAEIMISRINRFYGLNWRCIADMFISNKWKGSNILISCIDNVKGRKIMEGAFKHKKSHIEYQKPMYWLDFGNGKDFGQFVLGSNEITQPDSYEDKTSKLKNVIDMFPNMEENEEISGPSCSTREALLKQDLFINSILVSTGMSLLWRLLSDYNIDYHGGYVNLNKGVTKPIKI